MHVYIYIYIYIYTHGMLYYDYADYILSSLIPGSRALELDAALSVPQYLGHPRSGHTKGGAH